MPPPWKPVERHIHELLARQPKTAGRKGNQNRLAAIALAIFDLHRGRYAPFKLSRPQLLAILDGRIPDLNDSALRRAYDKLCEIGFVWQIPQEGVGQNVPGLAHFYYWTPETLAKFQLVGPNLAATPPEDLLARATRAVDSGHGSSISTMKNDQHKNNIILPGRENMMVEIDPSKLPILSSVTDFQEISATKTTTGVQKDLHPGRNFDQTHGRNCVAPFIQIPDGPIKLLKGKLKKMSKHERPKAGEEQDADWELRPVEIVEVREVVAGVEIKARTKDGLPLTGTEAGLMALLDAKLAASRDAVRRVREPDPNDAFDPAKISERIGSTLDLSKVLETKDERGARVAAEEEAKRKAIEEEVAKRVQTTFEAAVETQVFLRTNPEAMQAFYKRQAEIEVRAEMAIKQPPKAAPKDEDDPNRKMQPAPEPEPKPRPKCPLH